MAEETNIIIKETPVWMEWVRKFLPTLILLGSGLVGMVLFWDTQKNHSAEIDSLKEKVIQLEKDKADRETLKDLSDKVTAQYARAKEDRDNESKAIEEVADYMHYEKGRQAGLKEK